MKTGRERNSNKVSASSSITNNTLNNMNEVYGGRYGYRQTASGRWRENDEPDERTQLNQADAIRKKLQARKAAQSIERLKSGNKVPIKSGKKMFEEFCREAYKNRKQNIDDADMRNIFNAAQHLQTIKMGASVQSIRFLSFKRIPDDIFRHKRKA